MRSLPPPVVIFGSEVPAEPQSVLHASDLHARESQARFVARGESAIERWKREGGGRPVDDVLVDMQVRLDEATRRA